MGNSTAVATNAFTHDRSYCNSWCFDATLHTAICFQLSQTIIPSCTHLKLRKDEACTDLYVEHHGAMVQLITADFAWILSITRRCAEENQISATDPARRT